MSNFDISTLSNGIKVITRKNPRTPRTAINMFLDLGIKCEDRAGTASLAGRLLLQGTTTRSAEDIANELDNNAIEMNVDTKQDYVKIKSVFLNEDFDKALDILADITQNSTFEQLEREARKFKGEIEVDLDSPKTKASDNFVKNVYPDHPYGNTHTKVLNDLPEITIDTIRNYYSLCPEAMNIVIVGDIDKEQVISKLEEKFGKVINKSCRKEIKRPSNITENKIVTISKDDAAQAQIIQGWNAPDITSEDGAALAVLNTILGSSGLSSRLFVELRDKKGLAYNVRSSIEQMKLSGVFSVYIGTAPQNINTCIEGFNIEIKRLQDELVPEKELEDAKSNYLGKRAFFHETNVSQAYYLGYYDIMGLDADFDDKVTEKIKKVTAQSVKDVANKYLSGNSVTSILAPEECLKQINQ